MTSRVSPAAAIAAAFIALWSWGGSETRAQDASPPPAAPAEPALNSAPRPYNSLRPRRVRPVVRTALTAPRPATPIAAAAAPAVAQPAPVAPPAPSAATPLPAPELEAFVDGVVRRAMSRDHIAGVTISVVQNGQVVMKKGYGFANLGQRKPVDPDKTLFRVASISKTFTWIALMNEIEAGRMRLDGPVNLYLPEPLQVPSAKRFMFWDAGQAPIRLRDLMTHTAGFEDRSLGQLFERDPRRVRSLDRYLRQERPRRVREPGLLPSYSNYGAALAGAAVANVVGKPFEQLVTDEIILPAGMRHTTFREARPWDDRLPAPMNETLAADLSDGFSWTPMGWKTQPREFMGQVAPAASASSTAGDMARYMTLLLNGGTIDGKTVFSPKTALAFRTPMYRPAPDAAGWNAGFMDMALPGGRHGFGHGGATLYFHSNLVIAPDLGLGIFVSVNTDSGANLPATLPSTIIEHFYAPGPAVPVASTLSYDQARAYEGDYLTTRRAYGGLEGFTNRIIGRAIVRATQDGRLSITDGGVSTLFNGAERPGVFKAVDSPLTLVFDPNGDRPSRFYAARGWSSYERVGFFRSASLLSWTALIAGLASAATILGVMFRNRREARQTPVQARASQMQTMQAVLWLISAGCMGVFAAKASDQTSIFFGWPSGWLLSGSACALVASVLSLLTLGVLPMVWRGGRRVDSWSSGRKVAFTFSALLFVFLSVLLGLWGYLLPWS